MGKDLSGPKRAAFVTGWKTGEGEREHELFPVSNILFL
jgi:hypothetical protein